MNVNSIRAAVAFRVTNAKINVKVWLDAKATKLAVAFFEWSLSKHPVQEAVADIFSGTTPMCRLLREAVRDGIEHADRNIDADDIEGLERHVDSAIEHALRDFTRNELSDEVKEHIDPSAIAEELMSDDDALKELVNRVLEEMTERLQRG